MTNELKKILKKALKDSSGDTFYKIDKKTFMPEVFEIYCNAWFEENKELLKYFELFCQLPNAQAWERGFLEGCKFEKENEENMPINPYN